MEFFTWWYTRGWRRMAASVKRWLSVTLQMFSVPSLLRTLFAPWRRIITYPGTGLEGRLRAIADNLVSRCVGFTVRVFTLIAAGFSLAFIAVAGVAILIAWPFLPLGVVAALIKGVIG